MTFAPPSSGIYGVTNARQWIFIGESDNIQAALLDYLTDSPSAPADQIPTGFVFELCPQPRRPFRVDRLVAEYNPVRNRTASAHKSHSNS